MIYIALCFFLLILCIIYYIYGRFYVKAMITHNKMNYSSDAYKTYSIHETIYDTITHDISRVYQNLLNKHFLQMFYYLCIFIHTLVRSIIIKTNEKIFMSRYIWSIMFFINLPATISIAQNFKQHNCIYIHESTNKIIHNCIYYSSCYGGVDNV